MAMTDANGRPLAKGDTVTISRHHRSGESRPEQAIVIRVTEHRARVHIQDGPDMDQVAWITSRNVWLTPSGK